MILRLLVIIFLFYPLACFASPSISGVSGTVANGQSITITGTGFGATGPTIVLFDDFEKGTNGSAIATTSGSAQVGNWTQSDGQGMPIYSNVAKNSGSLSLLADRDGSESGQIVRVIFTGSKKIYQSWWVHITSGSSWPRVNWKMSWMGCDVDQWNVNDYTGAVIFDTGTAMFSFGTDDTARPTRYGYVTGGEWTVATDLVPGGWVRHEMYAEGSESSGIAQYWETGPSGRRTILNDSGLYTQEDGYSWNWLNIPGYGGQTETYSHLHYDDVYLATGDGARARIEICNSPNLSNATNCAVSTVSSWADTSITATVRGGSFGATDTAYLFVVDATGAVSSSREITFGSGETPAAVTTISGCSLSGATCTLPPTIYQNAVTITGTSTGATSCKWRIGSAPDNSNGTSCTGTDTWSCSTSGYQVGSNTLYVGCTNGSTWGTDSTIVTYFPVDFGLRIK
jgi:hypothetical protein